MKTGGHFPAGKRRGMTENYSLSDSIATAVILLVGTAEAVHLYGSFLHRPLGECAVVFGILALLVLGALTAVSILLEKKRRSKEGNSWSRTEKVLLAVFLLLVLTQLLYIAGGRIYRQGDMTVETVNSFLENNGSYQVNPLTGRPYAEGLPARIRILCLPSLYAFITSLFHISPGLLVWRVIPAVVFFCCLCAYGCLGKALFPERRDRRLGFLVIVLLLLWVGSYRYGMDGFGILFAGWRGVTLRNAILIPYALSLCLRKKYLHALLCAAAEACVVWTFYGLGAVLAVICGMALTRFACRKPAGEEAQS